jgi:hypothetical protein
MDSASGLERPPSLQKDLLGAETPGVPCPKLTGPGEGNRLAASISFAARTAARSVVLALETRLPRLNESPQVPSPPQSPTAAGKGATKRLLRQTREALSSALQSSDEHRHAALDAKKRLASSLKELRLSKAELRRVPQLESEVATLTAENKLLKEVLASFRGHTSIQSAERAAANERRALAIAARAQAERKAVERTNRGLEMLVAKQRTTIDELGIRFQRMLEACRVVSRVEFAHCWRPFTGARCRWLIPRQ